MSKEMIISVNGREKKIAIIENGRVSEFYIERGEENSGIVGNIYKGRVQRVLPGMQSAFVNIGLERDGFLYVSDFFDEEEEIERIVMEKSKKSTPEEATREATDRIERARLEREKQMEAAQDIAEPMAAETNTGISDKPTTLPFEDDSSGGDEELSGFVKISNESSAQNDGETTSLLEEERPKGGGRRERSRRGGGKSKEPQRGGDESRAPSVQPRQETAASVENTILDNDENPSRTNRNERAPVFEIEDSGFERIVDEDEETTGDMFKDAYVQEAIIDKVRAVEFDMESASTAEVGSLFDSAISSAPSGFERIADEDDGGISSSPAQKTEGQAVKGKRSRRGGGKNKNSAASAETEVSAGKVGAALGSKAPETQTESSETATGKDNQIEEQDALKSKKSEAKIVQETAAKAESDRKKAEAKSRKKDRGGKKTIKKETIADGAESAGENAQASVREIGDIAEMAVRRGGRGRRRVPGSENRPSGQFVKSEDAAEGEREDGDAESKSNGDSNSGTITNNSTRTGGNYNNSGNGGGRRDSRSPSPRPSSRPQQPTISDLLREGQDVLVQIAKEPIAKKGARITSHIALPGRFIVYMPTIEHLGVSRKIESASERSRLRTLIQKIKQEESIPSGGFIVRTAGVGISEEDLRQDARYLVRTWLDIKKTAEKAKSPALVHQDLDIIQRLLRDQLSDDFTAIRVDSEEEYLRTVEFVNRIQPRMVSRVKLYTREESILEAYGIQEEIDKALKPRVWLKSGGYLVINQTEALVAIDVNTGKFVGRGGNRLEDTITRTNMEAVDEIARQIRLRDLGGIIVLDLIDMEDRRNRHKVSQALQEALSTDKSPTKVLSFNDFGLIIMTRKRVKQSLERTLCTPCDYCEGAGWVKSPQTVCFEILEESRRLAKHFDDVRQTTLRVHPDVERAMREDENQILEEVEAYLGNVDIRGDAAVHLEQFDFAFI